MKKVDSSFSNRILEREDNKSTITGLLGFPHTSHSLNDIWVKFCILDEPLLDYENVKLL